MPYLAEAEIQAQDRNHPYAKDDNYKFASQLVLLLAIAQSARSPLAHIASRSVEIYTLVRTMEK